MCPLRPWEVVPAASYSPYQGNVSSEIALTDLAMVLVSWEEAHRQNVADGGSVHIFQTPCQGICGVCEYVSLVGGCKVGGKPFFILASSSS